MGKVEGHGTEFHSHVTAVTVAPNYRHIGMARKLMSFFEVTSEQLYDPYFVDLFVRQSNSVAISMYKSFEYSVFRVVRDYYTASSKDERDENAFDMRRPLKRDINRTSIRANGEKVFIEPEDTIFR